MPSSTKITLTRTPHQKQVFAKALLESGHSRAQVVKLSHLSQHTVEEIDKRTDYSQASIDAIQKRLPAKFKITADWAINNLTPEKMEKCSAPQLMMVAGIAVDKARDMEGSNRPIINIIEIAANVTKAISDSKARQAQLLEALQESKSVETQTV